MRMAAAGNARKQNREIGSDLRAAERAGGAVRQAVSLGGSATYGDLEKMLSEQKPDAVLIYTTIADHRKFIDAAAKHGISSMVEKPLSTTVEDAIAIRKAAREHHVQVLVNYFYDLAGELATDVRRSWKRETRRPAADCDARRSRRSEGNWCRAGVAARGSRIRHKTARERCSTLVATAQTSLRC